MKNFDEERRGRLEADRSFILGGETFTYKASVAPETVLRWSQLTGGEIPDLTEVEAIAIYDETVLVFLEEGQNEKWAKVRDPEHEFPLSIGDLRKLIRHLFEVTSDRPTGRPSGSSTGSGTAETETPSTDASSSQEAGG